MRGLSAGRVQSVVLRIIAEREKEIKNFKAQEYWTIEVDLKKNKEEFQASLIKQNNKKISQPGIEKEKEARVIAEDLKKAAYWVSQLEKKITKKNPLPPFTTSTLQQTAGQRFRFSAKFTMRIAQELYERGLITYHRTDSFNLSKESLRKASEIIKSRYGRDYYPEKPNYYKTKSQSAQEAHEAIRPSYPEKNPECSEIKNKLTAPQIKIYDIIWRRFLASQMKPALLNSYKADILAQPSESKNFPSKNKNYLLRVSGQQIKFDGFLRVYPLHLEESLLPDLKEKDALDFVKEHISQHFTQPPARYNEASLIKFLEKEGIGRPSTYAPIIDTIQKRNYVAKDEKKRFFPTEIGVMVNDILREHFPKIVDIKFTSQLENKLDQIAAGREKWDKVLDDFYQSFEKNLEKKYQEVPKKEFTEQTDKTCPKCGKPLVIKRSRFGKFYSCSNFPECDYKKSLPKPDLGINCPKCKKGKIVEKRTRKGKIFYGCNQWPQCDFALWDKPTGERCPLCGSLLVETKNKKIKCSNKDCSYGKK
jgi:DNA topoisomerase-1